jgi:hypothetical protein
MHTALGDVQSPPTSKKFSIYLKTFWEPCLESVVNLQ